MVKASLVVTPFGILWPLIGMGKAEKYLLQMSTKSDGDLVKYLK